MLDFIGQMGFEETELSTSYRFSWAVCESWTWVLIKIIIIANQCNNTKYCTFIGTQSAANKAKQITTLVQLPYIN
jgi:aminopeptidase C